MKSIQAQWVLGFIPTNQLPEIAADALSAGIESKSLVELAGLNGMETDDARKAFERALNELGYKSMEKADALRNYATTVSISMVESSLAPLEGAKRIWRATLAANLTNFHDLDTFIYAASELEDRPQDKGLFEKAILEEAARWSVKETPAARTSDERELT